MAHGNRTDVCIGISAKSGAVAAKQFTVCKQLGMYFQANHHLVRIVLYRHSFYFCSYKSRKNTSFSPIFRVQKKAAKALASAAIQSPFAKTTATKVG
jgi:hypothetical protein